MIDLNFEPYYQLFNFKPYILPLVFSIFFLFFGVNRPLKFIVEELMSSKDTDSKNFYLNLKINLVWIGLFLCLKFFVTYMLVFKTSLLTTEPVTEESIQFAMFCFISTGINVFMTFILLKFFKINKYCLVIVNLFQCFIIFFIIIFLSINWLDNLSFYVKIPAIFTVILFIYSYREFCQLSSLGFLIIIYYNSLILFSFFWFGFLFDSIFHSPIINPSLGFLTLPVNSIWVAVILITYWLNMVQLWAEELLKIIKRL